jgi:predicted GIY-YIG superfamily endonuclease
MQEWLSDFRCFQAAFSGCARQLIHRLKQHRLALSSFFRDKFQPHQLVEIMDLSDQTNQQLPKG